MQVWAVAQSVLTWHCGATSWEVTQYPIWHTLPDDPTQQSSFEKQGVRQTASTQTSSVTCTPTQSVLARHWGCAPLLGWQMPDDADVLPLAVRRAVGGGGAVARGSSR